MFDHISEHPKVRQKYSATGHIFNALLTVWNCDQSLLFVCDIFLIKAQFNKLTSVFHASVLQLIVNFAITLSKWSVDPRGDRQVDLQTTCTML